MRTVLAAVDVSSATTPVLLTAMGIGSLMDAKVEALHVREPGTETPVLLVSGSPVALRVVEGTVTQALLEEASRPEVIAVVIGTRSTPGDHRPAGHVAAALLQRAEKPLVVVPPQMKVATTPSMRRLLLPLDGTEASALPLTERLWPLLACDVDTTVLHVFTTATAPPILDHPARDIRLLENEFRERHCPGAAKVRLETGIAGRKVTDACTPDEFDLVVLTWSQDMTEGHARVVREVLTHSPLPVLLLPICSHDSRHAHQEDNATSSRC